MASRSSRRVSGEAARESLSELAPARPAQSDGRADPGGSIQARRRGASCTGHGAPGVDIDRPVGQLFQPQGGRRPRCQRCHPDPHTQHAALLAGAPTKRSRRPELVVLVSHEVATPGLDRRQGR
jgi:hypothetical protein